MTRVAYLVSRYPAVSHAFVQREVLALRAAGVEVHTFTLRRAEDAEVLTGTDRAEREQTWAVRPVRTLALARDHIAALARRPARYAAALARAVGRGRGLRGRLWQAFYFGEAVTIAAEMRRRDISHVHVHFANAAADVAMIAAELGDECRWSLTLHGPAEFFEVTGNRLEAKLRSAAWVACASDWARSQAMSLLPSDRWGHLLLVRGGVDPAAWRPDGARADGGALRLLNVGRLAPVKGQAVLIDAVALLRDRGVEVTAAIVGDGPERPALESRIAERGLEGRVELLGALGQDQVRRLYGEADVFCVPSFREGLPFVAIEALAMEVPVVATAIAGIPELVEDGVNGLLVPPGRADELAGAVARLAEDAQLRAELGRNGRETVCRDYDIGRLADELRRAFATPATAPVSSARYVNDVT